MSTKNNPSIKLPLAKSGNKVQIGLPSSKIELSKPAVKETKPKSIIPSLCAYGSDSSEAEEEEEEEIEALKPKTLPVLDANNKPVKGLLSLLPAPKSNVFIIKKNMDNSKQQKTSDTDFFNTSSSKNNSVGFTDSKLLVPRNLKSKMTDDGNLLNQISKKAKTTTPSYQTYVNRPDPEIGVEDEEINNSNENEDGDDEQEYNKQQFNPEEFGQTSLDQDALRQLGGRTRKNGQFNDIQFTDVKMDDVMGDSKKELLKNITSNYKPPSNREYFGGGGKKKSQITYLAYVAKEREEELKNSWANSAHNKKMSRQKYGF